MFAVVKIAGKQYIAEAGKKIKLSSAISSEDKKVKLSEVLFIADDKNVSIGNPLVTGSSVEAEVVDEGKGKKILVVKHHPKKRYRRTVGHRQDETVLKIVKINQK